MDSKSTEDVLYEKAKKTIKDSVFTHIFKDKKYQLELYKALHPEDIDINEDDIETVTVDTILVNTLYNDLGIKVKDKVLILVEAQSTWSWNIAIRILYYYADTCRKLYNKGDNNIYSSTKLNIIEPEFYMVYTGSGYGDVEYISLAEHFFNKKSELSNLDLKVKVIKQNINDNNILDQYIKFSKAYDYHRKKYENIIEAITTTIDECVEKDILSEYLREHRNEVYTMMTELYNQELATKSYGDEREIKGKLEGQVKTIIQLMREFNMSDEDIIQKISIELNVNREEAIQLFQKYN